MSSTDESTSLLPSTHNRQTMITPKILWRTGAAFVTIGVITGAFGAHGLRNRPGITPENIQAWQTAAQFSMFNGMGLLLVSMHPRFSVHSFAGPSIAVGTLLFSGSIFALIMAPKLKILGPITPLGGLGLIAGYASLIF